MDSGEDDIFDGFVEIPEETPEPTPTEEKGCLYIEARLKDSIPWDQKEEAEDVAQRGLQIQLNSEDLTFDLLEDILETETSASGRLGKYYYGVKDTLHSLKVVEYQGPVQPTSCFSSNDVQILVQTYSVYQTPSEEDTTIPSGEIMQLPHERFDGQWDQLVFDEDIKADLIWTVTNMSSRRVKDARRGMRPLVLLYGPPGTGKTSLCQGLAQKLSIRLQERYPRTTLIEIKTACLLSKYFAESAKQVDGIFTTIRKMCEEDESRFICVLIDEVESIATARESLGTGEAQDSLRATNALLTGLDRTQHLPNVMFLCTSNLFESLDPAFIDRCGFKHKVEAPTLAGQYEILRGVLQDMISQGQIRSKHTLPSYEDAVFDSKVCEKRPGSRLLDLVKRIHSNNTHTEKEISGRSLVQMPEQAILRYLRRELCTLDLAFGFMSRYVEAEQGQGKRKDRPEESNGVVMVERDDVADNRKRRKVKVLLENCEEGFVQRLVDTLQGHNGEGKVTIEMTE